MDRNKQARDEFAIAQQRHKFAQAVAQGQVGVHDRFGTLIQKDDLVIWFPPPQGLIFHVQDVGPDLSPQLPAGVMKLVLEATVPLQYRAGIPSNDLLKVGHQRAEGHAEIAVPVGAEEASNAMTALPAPALVAADSNGAGDKAATVEDTNDAKQSTDRTE